MYRKGHWGVALTAYAPLGTVALVAGFDTVGFVGGAAVIALAMLPDWDQRLPGLTHRGITHTVWAALVVGGVGLLIGAAVGLQTGPVAAVGLSAFGFLVGATVIVAHIAADALTPAGVRPFAPVDDRKYSLALVRADSPLANYALLGLGVFAVLLALGFGGVVT